MWHLICGKLSRLASVGIQHRYIRDATTDNYVVPEELLDDAHYAVELARSSTTLIGEHRRAVEEFATVLISSSPDLNSPNFFDTDPDWINLRNAAAHCVAQLGFNLEEYEKEDIESPRQ